MPMASSSYTSSLQQIGQVVPWDEPAINPNKSSIQYDGGNKQHQGGTHRIPDTYPSKYLSITDKRSTNQYTLIGQW